MGILIWAGTAVTLAGLAGLIWCIISIVRSRAAGLEEEALKARLQKIVVWNMTTLFLSVIGLMMVVVGIVLR